MSRVNAPATALSSSAKERKKAGATVWSSSPLGAEASGRVAFRLMLDLILFILLIILFALQFSAKRTPRVIVSVAVIGLSVLVVGDYQIKLYVCMSEQSSIARMFQVSKPTDDFSWAMHAANRYWRDKKKYTEGEPNYRSFASYLKEEPNAPSVDYD